MKRIAALALLVLLALAALPIPALAEELVTGHDDQIVMGGGSAKVTLDATVGAGNCSAIVHVVDQFHTPKPGASVSLQSPENLAETDENGDVLLTGLVRGVDYTIQVSCPGYFGETLTYTYWLQDYTQVDEITVQIALWTDNRPKPTATPIPASASASAGWNGESGGEFEVNEAGELVIDAQPGASRVLVPQGMAEESARLNAPIRVRYQDANGPASALVQQFTEHDAQLLQGNELWLEQLDDEAYLHVIVPWQKNTDQRDALMPHNLQATACGEALQLRGSFRTAEDPEGESYQYSNTFTPDTLEQAEAYAQFELGLRCDNKTGQGAVLAVNNAEHGDTGIPVPAALFKMAGETQADLVVQHHDPKNENDLLYGWKFAGDELKKADLSGLPASLDLFASDTPEPDDPILERTKEMDPQYLTVRYDGALPVTAALRIKDLKGFEGQAVDLLYSDPQADGLQTVVSAVQPDKDGYYLVDMEHCSSYALVAAAVPAQARPGWQVWLALALAVLLALIGAELWLIRRCKKKREEENA